MYCRKCGQEINDNANFCDKCGASQQGAQNQFWDPSEPRMTKREYFQSEICSAKSKKLIKAGWIIFWVYTALTILGLAFMLFGIFALSAEVDTDAEIAMANEAFEEILEESGMSLADIEELGIGDTIEDVIEFVLIAAILIYSVFSVATILLAFFTAYRRHIAVAVISLVVTLAFGGGLIAIGATVAMLVFVVLLDKEYKQYYMYGTNNNFY